MKKNWFLIGLLFLAALSRLVPHPSNFTPVTAMALLATGMLANRWLAFLLPLFALLVSDLFIGFYEGMIFTYMGLFAVGVVGLYLRENKSTFRIAGVTITGSLVFFILSNFGVWIAGGLYPLTFNGFVTCFANAIPFYGNSLAGDVFYVTVLFSSYSFYQSYALGAVNENHL